MSTITGVVDFFDASKGGGFIYQENGANVFVHMNTVKSSGLKTLKVGQHVEFTMVNKTIGSEVGNISVL
ncbi:cold-shock protein [Aliikangiella sp. IMCC44359]|uniref:cold-shock protein n=1 Tax=Aliikangiella sp. IMCC44359 TaxID=3459125 RepID=UPI00403AD102